MGRSVQVIVIICVLSMASLCLATPTPFFGGGFIAGGVVPFSPVGYGYGYPAYGYPGGYGYGYHRRILPHTASPIAGKNQLRFNKKIWIVL